MSNIDLSLDDIIAKTRIGKKAHGHKKSFKNSKFSGRKVTNGFKKETRGVYRDGGDLTKSVPRGKWRHDKLNESSNGTPSATLENVVNANKKVRMNISNLASSIVTADLEELFAAYSIDSAVVHYGEGGEHLGTGEIVMKKKDAQRAFHDLKGVAIDGSRLNFAIVDGGAGNKIFDRIEIVKKVNNGGIQKRTFNPRSQKIVKNSRFGAIQKRSIAPRARSLYNARHPLDRTDENTNIKTIRGKSGKQTKKSMTEEELNAELEAYMKN